MPMFIHMGFQFEVAPNGLKLTVSLRERDRVWDVLGDHSLLPLIVRRLGLPMEGLTVEGPQKLVVRHAVRVAGVEGEQWLQKFRVVEAEVRELIASRYLLLDRGSNMYLERLSPEQLQGLEALAAKAQPGSPVEWYAQFRYSNLLERVPLYLHLPQALTAALKTQYFLQPQASNSPEAVRIVREAFGVEKEHAIEALRLLAELFVDIAVADGQKTTFLEYDRPTLPDLRRRRQLLLEKLGLEEFDADVFIGHLNRPLIGNQ